jgi:hypothetical protein
VDVLLPEGAIYASGTTRRAILLAVDTTGHAHVKHINIHEHFIQERITNSNIKVVCTESANNFADIPTQLIWSR